MDRPYGPDGMQISRHWRLQSQRYRLTGVRYQDGSVSQQARNLSPREYKLNNLMFNFAGQVSYLKLAEEFVEELSSETNLTNEQIIKMMRLLLRELPANKELSYDALVCNERINKLSGDILKTQSFVDYLIDTNLLFYAEGFLSIIEPYFESLIEIQES